MSSLSSMFGSCMICYYVLVLIMVLDSVTCISFPTYSSTGPTPLAGWMSNPTTVAHPAVSGGAIGLGAPSISVWDLSACSMPFQATLVKDPGVSVNRVIWSPDGALFGKSFLILRDFCDHGGDEVQQHLEIDAHVGGVNLGIGFITFASAETHELGGSAVVVDRATPKARRNCEDDLVYCLVVEVKETLVKGFRMKYLLFRYI
ncbi:hypothetical protein V8G54_028352 [Vigna mungo]|uniref:Uncharacterized protein n=1 Tax=Vigna mungo TaxID=3915 RepID=A0AAQ3MSE4_VIGMU